VLLCANIVSKPVAADISHRILIVQPTGQVVEIPINTSLNSTITIQVPNEKIRIELPKRAPQKINKP
jgi:hypothetical protein